MKVDPGLANINATIYIVAHQQDVHGVKHSRFLIHLMLRLHTDAVIVEFYGFFIHMPLTLVP